MSAYLHTLVPILFVVLGLLVMGYGLRKLYEAWGSVDWPAVSGTILSSGVETSAGDRGGTLYSANVQYTYQVGDRVLTANQVTIGGPLATSWRSPAEAIVERYRSGAACRVSYDPEDPTESCLEPGAKWFLYIAPALGAIFAGSGIAQLLGWYTFIKP
ncbi:MAG TPA: DUF3592 domain-containing protein [Gemmatimonadales bacterium]|nr:DUF3592 domain-containing protein [Gemmatimonadales bacterium]